MKRREKSTNSKSSVKENQSSPSLSDTSKEPNEGENSGEFSKIGDSAINLIQLHTMKNDYEDVDYQSPIKKDTLPFHKDTLGMMVSIFNFFNLEMVVSLHCKVWTFLK
jgi:hypothetical protein